MLGAMIKTDKGYSTAILYQDDYSEKSVISSLTAILQYLTMTSPKNCKGDIRNNVNNCQQAIQKDDRWKYISLNHTDPTIRGLVKIHKDAPITPVINWKNDPAYNLDKMLSKKLQTCVLLPYIFNVKNTAQLKMI